MDKLDKRNREEKRQKHQMLAVQSNNMLDKDEEIVGAANMS